MRFVLFERRKCVMKTGFFLFALVVKHDLDTFLTVSVRFTHEHFFHFSNKIHSSVFFFSQSHLKKELIEIVKSRKDEYICIFS